MMHFQLQALLYWASFISISAAVPGCHPPWRRGGAYSIGSYVSATIQRTGEITYVTKNFECNSGTQPSLSHCPNYDPSNPIESSATWSDLGECSTSVSIVTPSPTSKPTPIQWSRVGCPDTWKEGHHYMGGDVVSINSIVYQCSNVQFVSYWCGDANYRPGEAMYWSIAWEMLGSCDDALDVIPASVNLIFVGGCPEEYSRATYQAGEKVAVDNVVYECKSWPSSLNCGREGYEPGGYMEDLAWIRLGYCDGTISPTTSPNFATLPDNHGCPEHYTRNTAYEPNDKVSILLDSSNSLVYQCSSDIHQSRFCSMFEPDRSGLVWKLVAHCDGTIAPTISPSFDVLSEIGEGCPREFVGDAYYEPGDVVSYEVSANPSRKVVYQCKAWPEGVYCNSGEQFAPGTENGKLGWALKGYCDGTFSPTSSPTSWEGVCTWQNGTTTVAINPWSVSSLSSYNVGTRVRKSNRIYKCSNWPYSLFCKQSVYEPESSTNFNYWREVWKYVGTCPMQAATATVEIPGSVNIGTNRRELAAAGTLSEAETADLLNAVRETLEEVACANVSRCSVTILRVNGQSVGRRLHEDLHRNLAQTFTINYMVVIETACSDNSCTDASAQGASVRATALQKLNSAVATNTFVSRVVENANVPQVATLLASSSATVTLETATVQITTSNGSTNTIVATASPTKAPAVTITANPTVTPTKAPSKQTNSPGSLVTTAPTKSPTKLPTRSPTQYPSKNPTKRPSSPLTSSPTAHPSDVPSTTPSEGPSALFEPSGNPSVSAVPSENPSTSARPSGSPSESAAPSNPPSRSSNPTETPSTSEKPSSSPSLEPSINPLCINEDFGSGNLNGWYADNAAETVVTEGGESFMAVTQRTGRWAGPKILLPMDCIEEHAKYLLFAKIRLKHSTGGVSNCTNYEQLDRCPQLTLQFQKTSTSSWDYHSVVGSTLVGSDEHWIEMSTTINFYRDYPGIATFYKGPYLYFQGPEIEVDIHMDEFILRRVPELDFGVIRPEQSSENIVLPDPPKPTAASLLKSNDRTGCPHVAIGLLNWHDASTWSSGSVPVSGDVTIPLGASVVISRSISSALGTILIPNTSSLILGEHVDGIEINAHGFDVRGSLIAGSETCRIETSITITLYGNRPSDRDINGTSPTAIPTYKGIAVTGGTLSLHGKRFHRTWARLAQTMRPGDHSVHTQHPVNWEVGQELVLVTTALRDDRAWHQNEVRSIVSVRPGPDGVGSVITVDSPVLYKHIANFAYQGEVGLLSRTIKVQGSESDSQPESDIDYGNYTGTRWVQGNYFTPNPNKSLLGFGGHIMIKDGGIGYVEGVELYRMGQTNFLGRYPIHFHLLGNGCADCYFRDSSVHKSFYRCVSIHGTHNLTISENVAFDVLGYCYYLEDGVEQDNTISFNLGSHVHFLGTAPWGDGQQVTAANVQSVDRILPADSTASAFYITNMANNIIGNVASGGWAGFAFPTLREPLGPSRFTNMRPSAQRSKTIDGNTAHSTGWWWEKAAGFYLGGSLYYRDSDNLLVYDAGRGLGSTPTNARERWPCLVDKCALGDCDSWCGESDFAWNKITNSKMYSIYGSGLNSWAGRMEVLAIETHDVGLALEALESGFWIDRLLSTCRTGEDLAMPRESVASYVRGNGFVWYDTGQEHIMTNSTFRNCGSRSSALNPYDQYDSSPTRGCSTDRYNGCNSGSSVFGLLTHSDEFNPEIMQITSNIVFDDCGRRFKMARPEPSTVSGRIQNWLDADGSLLGMDEPLIAGSGLPDAASWWEVEDEVIKDTHGPLTFIRQNRGPVRGLGHVNLEWDAALHSTVGVTVCGNGDLSKFCPAVGYIRHMGTRFDGDPGLPVTAQAEVAGPVGGFGWLLSLNNGAPRALNINNIELLRDTPLLLSVQYPIGTEVSVTFSYPQASRAAVWNRSSNCENAAHYYDSSTGLLTVRVIGPERFFSRANLTLPRGGNLIKIQANCTSSDGIYCNDEIIPITSSALNLCPEGYSQTAYDICCSTTDPSACQDVAAIYASGAAASSSSANTNNLVSDPSFEGECGGRPWYADGSTVLEVDRSNFSNGTQSMKVTFRKSSWNGVRQDMTGVFLPGNTYQISYYARFLDVDAQLALKLAILLSTGSYTYIGHSYALSTSWTYFSRQYTVPAGAKNVVMYIESVSTPAGADGYYPGYAVDGFEAYQV